MAGQLTAPKCDIDFYGHATLADPVPAYHQMLDLGPVVWMERHQVHAIIGFDPLTASLRNHRVFQSGKGVSINEDVNRVLIGSTLNSDPPAHDQTRAITFRPLSPKGLEDVRAQIEAEAVSLVDRMVNQGSFDAAAELAPHIPLTVVRELVGLGEHGRDHMLEWGAATFELMGDARNRAEDAKIRMTTLRAFLEDPDVLDALTPNGWARRATQKGIEAGIEPSKAVELMRDYIAPSLDTTISAISYGVRLFAENPRQWQAIRADRGLIPGAIEEIVRLNTPIRAFTRFVAQQTEVAGITLRKGSRVLMVFGAANRDPQKFADPDRFDITRSTRGHVGFGHGVHTCLGMHLARLEMRSLFNALADRVARFDLTGPVTNVVNATIHAHARVPVKVTRA